MGSVEVHFVSADLASHTNCAGGSLSGALNIYSGVVRWCTADRQGLKKLRRPRRHNHNLRGEPVVNYVIESCVTIR